MRIVLIVPDCGEGGLFQFYNQVVPVLAAADDVHVIFASPMHSPLDPVIPGATCHRLQPEDATSIRDALLCGPLAIAPNAVRALAAAHQAWGFARTLEPDCVEVCDWPLGAVPAALDGSVPVVVQCHGSLAQIARHDPAPGSEVEAMVLRLIEPQVLGTVAAVQSYARANAGFWEGASGRRVDLIRPAFALPADSLPAGDDGAIRVFGRLQAWKGPQVLCAALNRLGASAPACDWYGSAKPWPGTAFGTDAHLAAAWPAVWRKSLRFHGAVDRNEVARLMSQSRAVIVPSTWDVFNFTAVEAMALARPVLVSTGAGASELIEDGVNGFVFAGDDPVALADAIARLETLDTGARADMGRAARETVARDLDPARIAEARREAYLAAIEDHARAPPRGASAWLRELLDPAAAVAGFDLAQFLDTLPARPMARALAARARRKLLMKARP